MAFNFENFVRKAVLKHGHKYEYPSDTLSDKKIRVLCREHGEFEQRPEKHLFGQGCPWCGGRVMDHKAALIEAFPDFDWSNVDVPIGKKPMKLTCQTHGDFTRTRSELLTNRKDYNIKTPCPKCNKASSGISRRTPADESRQRVLTLFNGTIDLDTSTVVTVSEKARFICNEHGEFWSVLQDVLGGHGCYKCGVAYRNKIMTSTFDEFLAKARTVHGDNYEYDPDTYVNVREPTRIVCKKHGEFWQIPRNHTNLAAGCPSCANSISTGEIEVSDLIQTLVGENLVIKRDRSVLKGMEIDVLVPHKMIGVEYCGLYWHGESRKDKSYHIDKHRAASEAGIKLLTIFEDEWLFSKEKVIERLKAHLCQPTTVYARKTKCVRVEWVEAKAFLEKNHMQGPGQAGKANYGLFNGEKLVAIGVFGLSRFDKSAKYELLRYCSVGSERVVGGLGKIFKAFVTEFSPESVVSYADQRWGDGGAYGKIGFVKCGDTIPGYFWCKGSNRFTRYDFQKHKLGNVLEKFDANETEVQNCHANGYWRIYDCGHAKWLWQSK